MVTRFASLWLAWFLVPLYAVWAALWLRQHRRSAATRAPQHGHLRYSSTQVLARLPETRAVRMRTWIQRLRLGSVALILVALLRPQTLEDRTEVTASGIDIVLAIDASGSMEARDLDADKPIFDRRTRLGVIKDVVQQFVARRPSDLLGLVVFGADAYTLCPLTLDHGVVDAFLQSITPGMAGKSTAIGDGLGAAINRLRHAEGKSRIIILLTDGSNNSGTLLPKEAAEAAHALGLKVYTVGAGGRGPAPVVVEGMFGRKQVVELPEDIDEPALRQIAQITGGAYYRAEDTNELEAIYARIDALEKSPVRAPTYMEAHEHFAWLLIPALILLILEVVLLETRLRPIP
jgi:Ca-activated chloride channel family protein